MIQSLLLLDLGLSPEEFINKLIPNWTSFVVQLLGLISLRMAVFRFETNRVFAS